MALAEVGARLRLAGADRYRRDADRAADSTRRVGDSADRAERGLRGMSGAAGRAGKALGRIAGKGIVGGLGAAAVGIGGLSVALFQGFKDAAALQTMLAKTNAVIASTKGVANVSASGVRRLADDLESLSGIEGDAIINAQNLLLTFTNVRNGTGEMNHVFDQATKTAVDMAAALGSDPSAAAMQLGKALNNPIKGVGALSKVGVSFTEQQKKTIKSLVASGKTMDAQKIILRELQTEFGGAAKAAGSGFEGSMARAKDALGDLFRDLATPLLPTVTEQFERFSNYVNDTLAPRLTSLAEGFANNTGEGGKLRDRMKDMGEKLRVAGGHAKTAFDKIQGFVSWMADHETTVKTFAAAIAGYAVAVRALAVAGALAAAVKWAGLALGISSVGAAAAGAGAAGTGGLALFAAGLTPLFAVGGPVLLAIAALGSLYWAMKRVDSPENVANIQSGTRTATTGPQIDPNKPIPGLTFNGKPVPGGGRPGVEVVTNTPVPSVSTRPKRTANSTGSGAAPVVTVTPAPVTVVMDRKVVGQGTVTFLQDKAARQ